jgi:alpha,alpha-trehalose phosphorylase
MRLAFRLCFRGRRLMVEVGREQATYSLLEGPPLEIRHHGRRATLDARRALTRKIPAAPRREPPRQPRGRAPARRERPGATAPIATPGTGRRV